MISKILKRGVTTLTLFSFLVCSSIPAKVSNEGIEAFQNPEAIFGWCKLKRIEKKTSKLLKSIEKYKQGKESVDVITLQIASLKRTANKAFKKNYKVREIMQRANEEIETFMLNLVNDTQEREEFLVSKGEQIELSNLPDSYESVNLFVEKLQDYEDNDWKIGEDRQFLKELNNKGYSERASSNGIDDKEANVLFAYVSIFCGCLLCMIPTGFTQGAGYSLIGGGLYTLGLDEWEKRDEINKINREKD